MELGSHGREEGERWAGVLDWKNFEWWKHEIVSWREARFRNGNTKERLGVRESFIWNDDLYNLATAQSITQVRGWCQWHMDSLKDRPRSLAASWEVTGKHTWWPKSGWYDHTCALRTWNLQGSPGGKRAQGGGNSQHSDEGPAVLGELQESRRSWWR